MTLMQKNDKITISHQNQKKKRMKWKLRRTVKKHKEPNKAAFKTVDTNLHFQKFLIKYFQKLPFIK